MLDRVKLLKILNLTTSDNDGEALNAIRAANRMLKQAMMPWDRVLHPPKEQPKPRQERPFSHPGFSHTRKTYEDFEREFRERHNRNKEREAAQRRGAFDEAPPWQGDMRFNRGINYDDLRKQYEDLFRGNGSESAARAKAEQKRREEYAAEAQKMKDQAEKEKIDAHILEMFTAVRENLKVGSDAEDFIDSLYEQWTGKNSLSEKQMDALEKFYENTRG